MKKTYVKPAIEMETFSPNEYIAACYAIVDVNDPTNFAIKGNWNGKGTDGQNSSQNGKWYWRNNGFDDDHFDYLDHPTWKESHTGWFYDGPGMNHSTSVSTWEAAGDTQKGETMVSHTATQVNIVEITEGNAASYNTGANAS